MGLTIKRTTVTKAGLLFAVWTVYGLLSAWQTHYWYAFSKEPMSWPEALRLEMGYGYIWTVCTPFVLWLSNRYRIDRKHRARNLAVHIGAMTVLAVATKTVFDFVCCPPNSAFIHFTWLKLFRSIELTADTAVLLYWVIVLSEHAFVYYTRYQNGLVNASRLQAQLAKAQLQALKMQLHPHFLFNALHTVSELVHEDPDLAERTIARLSELLRLFLANSMVHEVTLAEELRILGLYLDIERTRFEQRLRVYEDVPGELRDAMVPNLLLQPLFENSIRHGLSKRAEPGWISITAEKFADTVVLRIADNGAGFDPDAEKTHRVGLGLANTRNRLETLYGTGQSLDIRNLPAGGVEVRITMPFRAAAESAESKEGEYAGENAGENAAVQNTDR